MGHPDFISWKRFLLARAVNEADAVTLILELSRRGEALPATFFAVIFGGWGENLADGYGVRANPHSDCSNHGVRGEVYNRNCVGSIIGHIGSRSIWRDGDSDRLHSDWNRPDDRVCRGIDDGDAIECVNCYVGAGPIWSDGDSKWIFISIPGMPFCATSGA